MEAGRSLGLGYLPTMTFIVVPQAFKAILPALGNEFITLLKDTSLISAIAEKEVVYFAKAIGAKTYDYMFPPAHHRGDVSDFGAHLHLAPGDSGKEAARK